MIWMIDLGVVKAYQAAWPGWPWNFDLIDTWTKHNKDNSIRISSAHIAVYW